MSDSYIEKGIITYMYLENFVTYDKVAMKPGRNLNVVIGPNGTGKSTVVCGIVLGLGGKPSTIGRALHVAEYIKAGCNQAKIEIHLKNGNKRDIIITRIFDLQGKSLWYLNGKTSNIKQVQELTKSLDIQIDNLCQFLPQDKVQDFSKMNAQELLKNTERSVGNPIVLEHHEKLIEYRSHHRELETQLINKRKLLQSRTQIQESLKETVSRINERKLINKKIISLKQKKGWILYDEKRTELVKFKKKKSEAAAQLASLEAEMKPINDAIEKLKAEVKKLETSVNDRNNKIHAKNVRLKEIADEIIGLENNIKECENMCKFKIQAEEARDHEVELEQEQKNKLENDLSLMMKDVGSEENLEKLKREILSRMENQRDIINTLTNQISTLKQQDERITLKITASNTELEELRDIELKRLQLLKELRNGGIDAYKGVLWLRQNQDKFIATIHEPMLLTLNVKDISYTKYIENIISYRDLTAFVCENKQDMNLLLQYLRDEQNLQVNAVHSDPMRQVSMQPRIPLENIQGLGFTHYLVSLVEAPETIMKYLVSMYNLTNIPVGSSRVEDNADRIPPQFSSYFSENYKYSVTISKYTGQKSTRMEPIGRANLLLILDKSKILQIEKQLKILRNEKNNVFNELKKLEEQLCEEHKVLDKHRADRNKFQQDSQQIRALRSRISMVDKKIAQLENDRCSVEKIRQRYTTEIKALLRKELKLYNICNSELAECFKLVTDNEQIQMELQQQKRLLRTKMRDSEEIREEGKIAERRLAQITTELVSLRNEVLKIYNEALELTNGIKPTDKAFEAINKTFSNLPSNIDAINKDLNIAEAKIYCMKDNPDGEYELRQYEQVEGQIHDLNQFIQVKTKELEKTVQQMEILKEKWLVPLKETVNRINASFSRYFSAMNCAGEVTLAVAENVMDFDEYGLKIRVKFRDTDQLQELTRHHQSGGERAVTTAIYMISLQELSRVPFRCVDEINQGMDAINERRVFNLLVRMTGTPTSSQYFLLTPKLLPNLDYAETVTVHCVFNGPFMISHTEFDTEDYCKHVTDMREKEYTDED